MRLTTIPLFFALLFCALFSSRVLGQARDCYPNCSVTVRAVLNERVPLFSSVNAIGNPCYDQVITRMLKQFEDEDMRDIVKYRNEYCSALSGWIAVGDCQHGGPPPCCTYTGPSPPWSNIGAESAKARLMNAWHKVKNDRHDQIEKELNACLRNLTSSNLSDFNSLYADAVSCEQTLASNKNYMATHSVLVNSYVAKLNELHNTAKGWVASTDPNNLRNEVVFLQKLKDEICNTTTSPEFNKLSSLPNNGAGGGAKNNNQNQGQSTTRQNNNSNTPVYNNGTQTTRNPSGYTNSNQQRQQQQQSQQPQQRQQQNSMPTSEYNAGISNAQDNIVKAGTATDPIMQAMYLSQAKVQLTYEQTHGGNPATIQRLRQQIAAMESASQQNSQNQLKQLMGTTTPTPQETQQKLDNLIEKNSALEREKQNNKEDVKQSLNDFFNSAKFPAKPADTPQRKPDTTRIKKTPSAHN